MFFGADVVVFKVAPLCVILHTKNAPSMGCPTYKNAPSMSHPEHKKTQSVLTQALARVAPTRGVMRSFAERIAEQNRGAKRRWDLLWIALGLPNEMLHF